MDIDDVDPCGHAAWAISRAWEGLGRSQGAASEHGLASSEPAPQVHHRCLEWYTPGVPTSRPRHQVTETDELAAALDEAAVRWPGLSRGQLITRLALEGHRAVVVRQRQHRTARLEALRRHGGALTDVYPQGYVDSLREDWPE